MGFAGAPASIQDLVIVVVQLWKDAGLDIWCLFRSQPIQGQWRAA
jgi:hypothetical protein